MADPPKTEAMNPAVVQFVGQVAEGLKVPLLTTITNEPSNLPLTPAATVPPGFVSHPPGLGPALVTKLPSLNSSVSVYVPFGFGEVRTIKCRSKASLAQSFPQVPESGEVLGKGP